MGERGFYSINEQGQTCSLYIYMVDTRKLLLGAPWFLIISYTYKVVVPYKVLERHNMAGNVVLPNHSLVLPTWSSFTNFLWAKMLALYMFVTLFLTSVFLKSDVFLPLVG
jgi:hypothetical protein